jgi:hypothetical protein
VTLLLVVLGPDDFGLLCFLFFGEEDGLLDFALLVLPLLVQHVVLLGNVSLAFVLNLVVVDFLQNISVQNRLCLLFEFVPHCAS